MTTQTVAERYAHEIVAANVRAELARAGISGRRAADQLGLGVLYVSRRLNGSIEMDINDVVAFANLLNVDIATLFEGTEKVPTPKGEGQMVPSGRIELPTYSLQADGFAVTPMLPVAAEHDDTDSDAIHSVTPIRRLA